MSPAETANGRTLAVQWGLAARPRSGYAICGDQALVTEALPGTSMVAVADGLGHGAEAAAAAERALEVIQPHATEPLPVIMEHCHAALSHTRGVALSLASLSAPDKTLTWLGVGNVMAVLLRFDRQAHARRRYEHLMLSAGIVGVQLPSLRAAALPLAPGDMLFVATDGLGPGWSDELRLGDPQRLASELVEHHGNVDDDALVLVARFLGETR